MEMKTQTPRGIDLTSMHTNMPREVDKIFARHPSNLGGGRS